MKYLIVPALIGLVMVYSCVDQDFGDVSNENGGLSKDIGSGEPILTVSTCSLSIQGNYLVIEANVTMPADSYDPESGDCIPKCNPNWLHLDLRKIGHVNGFDSANFPNLSPSVTGYFDEHQDTWMDGRVESSATNTCSSSVFHVRYSLPLQTILLSSVPNQDPSDPTNQHPYVFGDYWNFVNKSSYPGITAGSYYAVFFKWFGSNQNGSCPGVIWDSPIVVSNTVAVPNIFTVSLTGPSVLFKPNRGTYVATVNGSVSGTFTYRWEYSHSPIGMNQWSPWSVTRVYSTTSLTDTKQITMPYEDIRQRVIVKLGADSAISPIKYTWNGAGEM